MNRPTNQDPFKDAATDSRATSHSPQGVDFRRPEDLDVESLVTRPTPSMEAWMDSKEYDQILLWANAIIWDWEPHG